MIDEKPQPTILHRSVAIIILIVILGGILAITWLLLSGISKLTAQQLIPIFTAIIPAVVGFIAAGATIYAAIRTKSAERLKEIEQELRKQKAPIYEEFTDFLLGKVLKNAASEDEMKEFVIKFSQKMLVWGDDNVIKAWVDFKKNVVNEEFQYQPLFLIENVLLSIRADMGHSNKGLKRGDLLTLFINDMDKAFESEKIFTSNINKQIQDSNQ